MAIHSITFYIISYYTKLKENIVFQPPICENGENLVKRRRKRQTRVIDETQGDLYDTDREDLKVKVYSGLYVNEASDLDDAFLDSDVPTEIVSILQHIVVNTCFKEKEYCIIKMVLIVDENAFLF